MVSWFLSTASPRIELDSFVASVVSYRMLKRTGTRQGAPGVIIEELLSQFPNAATTTLARIAARDNPAVFAGAESARRLIQYYRGGAFKGVTGSHGGKVGSHAKPADWRPKPAEGLKSLRDWKTVQVVSGQNARCLVLSDIHVPYHDGPALELALSCGDSIKPTHIILNGDTLDFYGLSRWEHDPRKRDLKGELDAGLTMLEMLRERYPKARITFKEGNHEERMYHWMLLRAPELIGIDDFNFPHLLRFKQLRIDHVGQKQPIRLGSLSVVHGHEFAGSITNPVNPARGLYNRAHVSSICGHHHQTSQHSEKDLDGHIVSCWSTGCLCDLHPDYMPINKHGHGFATVMLDRNDAYTVNNYRIIGGKVY